MKKSATALFLGSIQKKIVCLKTSNVGGNGLRVIIDLVVILRKAWLLSGSSGHSSLVFKGRGEHTPWGRAEITNVPGT